MQTTAVADRRRRRCGPAAAVVAGGRADCLEIPPNAFCFATTVFGDPYYVEFAPGRDDGPVSLRYHDGNDAERIADSLTEFLNRPRRAPEDDRA